MGERRRIRRERQGEGEEGGERDGEEEKKERERENREGESKGEGYNTWLLYQGLQLLVIANFWSEKELFKELNESPAEVSAAGLQSGLVHFLTVCPTGSHVASQSSIFEIPPRILHQHTTLLQTVAGSSLYNTRMHSASLSHTYKHTLYLNFMSHKTICPSAIFIVQYGYTEQH